ncbi:O-methyltransferase [Leptospira sp. 96542]|nr:O-methyltransferase [Leptospira sp. 96542]
MKPRPSVFINDLENYIDQNLVKRPNPVFLEMEGFAKEKNIPIVSAATGAVLHHLVQMTDPNQILELGTGLGYSTLWMHLAKPNVKIITVDRNAVQANAIDLYSEKMKLVSPPIERVTSLVMEYLDSKHDFSHTDFYFVDCDKIMYPDVYDVLFRRAKPGAVLVYDNVLWHGRILNPDPQKPSDLAVQSLWNKVKSSNLPYTLFPCGDGLLFFRKDKK